jgi:hypothetical protein
MEWKGIIKVRLNLVVEGILIHYKIHAPTGKNNNLNTNHHNNSNIMVWIKLKLYKAATMSKINAIIVARQIAEEK